MIVSYMDKSRNITQRKYDMTSKIKLLGKQNSTRPISL